MFDKIANMGADEVNKFFDEAAALQKKFADAKSAKDAEIKTVSGNIEKLTADSTAQTTQIAQLELQLNGLVDKAAFALCDQLDTLRTEMVKTTTDLRDAESQLGKLQDEQKTLAAELSATDGEVAAAKAVKSARDDSAASIAKARSAAQVGLESARAAMLPLLGDLQKSTADWRDDSNKAASYLSHAAQSIGPICGPTRTC